jgi:glycosyltransferase involved in cell wall biosynthesis
MPGEPLRIAFATHEYVTEKGFDGGIGNYIHRVTKALASMGHDVHVITLSTSDQTDFDHDGVRVHRVPFGKKWLEVNRLTRYRLTTTMHLLALSSEVSRKLKQLHSERPFHLVQFPDCSFCGLFSIVFRHIPHVVRASWYQPVWNDSDQVRPNMDFRAVAWLEKLQLRLSRNIYAPSRTLQRILAREAGLDRVRVIPTPAYIENLEWDYSIHDELVKGKKYLLFFGRFELRKGFHILAQSLPRFLECCPDAYAVLIGRDKASAIAPSMADHARSLCVDFNERLIVIDQLPHRKLYPVISGAHLVTLPSLMDNLPNACLEAMVLGKPVIGTQGASFDELIDDGKTGFLVTPNDVGALAKKLVEAWTDPKLQQIGEAAKQRMMELLPEKTVQSLLSYYREILGR